MARSISVAGYRASGVDPFCVRGFFAAALKSRGPTKQVHATDGVRRKQAGISESILQKNVALRQQVVKINSVVHGVLLCFMPKGSRAGFRINAVRRLAPIPIRSDISV